jgi:hypothetical protein
MTQRRAVDLGAVRAARANLRRLAREHPELTGPPSEANRRGWEREIEEAMADEKNPPLVIRLPAELRARIDKYGELLKREQPGPEWNRSDVVRLLLTRALDDVVPAKRGKR